MEKTVSTPFWTGLMLMEIDVRRGQNSMRRRHKLHDLLFSGEGRIAYKGQLFSAPINWRNVVKQLEARDLIATNWETQVLTELEGMRQAEAHISLPVMGAVLAQRVRVVVTAGLVDVNKLLRQATVRRSIVIQLMRMHRDANHPDYQRDSMEEVEIRARRLAPY